MPLPGVRNEPVTDFSLEANRTAMQSAPAQGRRGRRERGKDFPLVIGGQRLTTYDKFYSRNPSNVDEIVAVLHKASPREVERAVEAADRAFPSWSRVPAEDRAAILLRAADRLRRRKFIAAAWQVYEVGKNWGEADADVAETIDHL